VAIGGGRHLPWCWSGAAMVAPTTLRGKAATSCRSPPEVSGQVRRVPVGGRTTHRRRGQDRLFTIEFATVSGCGLTAPEAETGCRAKPRVETLRDPWGARRMSASWPTARGALRGLFLRQVAAPEERAVKGRGVGEQRRDESQNDGARRPADHVTTAARGSWPGALADGTDGDRSSR